MLHKTKTVELNTHDLDTLTVLLRRELTKTTEWLRTAPLDHLFDLVKRLEAAREDLSREIFAASAWVNGIEDTYNQMLDID